MKFVTIPAKIGSKNAKIAADFVDFKLLQRKDWFWWFCDSYIWQGINI